MRISRILSGILKTALTWAVVWVPISLIPLGVAALFGARLASGVWGPFLISQALMGAINGAVFAGVLAIAGRRKTFETLSLPWIASCGGVGAAMFPFVFRAVLLTALDVPMPAMALLSTLVSNAVLGAGLATLTLSIARRAPALPASESAAQPAIDAGAG